MVGIETDPQKILKQLQANPNDEHLQEEFHQLMEFDPILFQKVLKLMGSPIAVPRDRDEDKLSGLEEAKEQKLDSTLR